MININNPLTKITYDGKELFLYDGSTNTNKLPAFINNQLEELTPEDFVISGEENTLNIMSYAFYGYSSIKRVTLPNVPTTIGNYAFSQCTGLENIDFAKGCILGSSVFNGVGAKIYEFELEDNSANSVYALQGSKFTKITIGGYNMPNLPTDCLAYTFAKYIYVREGVTTIGRAPWQYNGAIVLVVLPSTVTSIANQVFYNNNSTKNIILKATIPPTLAGLSMTGINTWYVPYESIEQYKSATNWSVVATILNPLVKNYADLSIIDTSKYTKACVEEEDYKKYQYSNGQWYEVTE